MVPQAGIGLTGYLLIHLILTEKVEGLNETCPCSHSHREICAGPRDTFTFILEGLVTSLGTERRRKFSFAIDSKGLGTITE